MNQLPLVFWCVSATEILQHLRTAKEGLSGEDARQRLAHYGSNLLKPQERSNVLTLVTDRQFNRASLIVVGSVVRVKRGFSAAMGCYARLSSDCARAPMPGWPRAVGLAGAGARRRAATVWWLPRDALVELEGWGGQ